MPNQSDNNQDSAHNKFENSLRKWVFDKDIWGARRKEYDVEPGLSALNARIKEQDGVRPIGIDGVDILSGKLFCAELRTCVKVLSKAVTLSKTSELSVLAEILKDTAPDDLTHKTITRVDKFSEEMTNDLIRVFATSKTASTNSYKAGKKLEACLVKLMDFGSELSPPEAISLLAVKLVEKLTHKNSGKLLAALREIDQDLNYNFNLNLLKEDQAEEVSTDPGIHIKGIKFLDGEEYVFSGVIEFTDNDNTDFIYVNDTNLFDQLDEHAYLGYSRIYECPVTSDVIESLDHLWIEHWEHDCDIGVTLSFNANNWKNTFPVDDFMGVFSARLEQSGFNAEVVNANDEDGNYLNKDIRIGKKHLENELLTVKLAQMVQEISNIYEFESQLLFQESPEDVFQHVFKFPDEYKTACNQYLMWFGDFIKKLGIDAKQNFLSDENTTTVIIKADPSILPKMEPLLYAYMDIPFDNPHNVDIQSVPGLNHQVDNIRRQLDELRFITNQNSQQNHYQTELLERIDARSNDGVRYGPMIENMFRASSNKKNEVPSIVTIEELTLAGVKFNVNEGIKQVKSLVTGEFRYGILQNQVDKKEAKAICSFDQDRNTRVACGDWLDRNEIISDYGSIESKIQLIIDWERSHSLIENQALLNEINNRQPNDSFECKKKGLAFANEYSDTISNEKRKHIVRELFNEKNGVAVALAMVMATKNQSTKVELVKDIENHSFSSLNSAKKGITAEQVESQLVKDLKEKAFTR